MTNQDFMRFRSDQVSECLRHLSYAELSAEKMVSTYLYYDPITAKYEAALTELSGIIGVLSASYPDFKETESYLRLKALVE